MKIYFSGSIAGGREKVNDYAKIVNELKKYGEILDKHVANPSFLSKNDPLSPEQIYKRDVKWIDECDTVFAEVTVPSLGVGYELAYAESKNKKVICMYEEEKNISKMITGNMNFIQIPYANVDELISKIHEIMK